jgi:transcriptional regulator with XRE-family HTH domain
MVQVRNVRTVAETVASNVRGFRQLRGIEQATVALRMVRLGIAWRQGTVSEVERGQRNVTVAELLALALALETTVEQLLDPRGPERIRGPWLSLAEVPPENPPTSANSWTISAVEQGYPDDPDRGMISGLAPEWVSALVCMHTPYPDVEWDDDGRVKHLWFEKAEPR